MHETYPRTDCEDEQGLRGLVHMKTESSCDEGRLLVLLDSKETMNLESDVMLHLNECPKCRDRLETLAADACLWNEAREMLSQSEFDVASVSQFSAATIADSHHAEAIKAGELLNSLAPSDFPHSLGRLGNYEITGVVGAGGMGVVLKAVDPSLDRVVAIKVMAPHMANRTTARKRFAREARAAAAVLHPNVIPIHSVVEDSSTPHLVMAYIRGSSLQKRIEKAGALETVEILRIGSQIAAGLSAAHDQGLVHRDVKPENILLENDVDRVTLTDFGLARAVDDVAITREGGIAGTPQYMSPEQARGQSLDQSSDLFSLGSVLYTLCTGKAPFQADSSYGIMRSIVDDEPRPIQELNSRIPAWLCVIVRKLMSKSQADRYSSAQEVHELLEGCLSYVQHPGASELPDSLAQPVDASRDRHWIRNIAIGLGVMACLMFTIIYYIQTDKGVLKVETESPSLKVEIQGDSITLTDVDEKPITLRRGDYKLIVSQGENELITDNFEIRRNGKTSFRIEILRDSIVVFKQGQKSQSASLPGVAESTLSLNMEADDLLSGTLQNETGLQNETHSGNEDIPLIESEMLNALGNTLKGVSLPDMNSDIDVATRSELVDELTSALHQHFPDSKLKVSPIHKACIISGQVNTAQDVEQIVQIAEQFFPTVINKIQVPESRDSLLQESAASSRMSGSSTIGLNAAAWWSALKPSETELQGVWQATYWETEGVAVPQEMAKGVRFEFQKESLAFWEDDERREFAFTVDQSAAPKRIDFFNARTKYLGIFDISGNTLRICYGSKERPRTFDSENGQAAILLRKVKDDESPYSPQTYNPSQIKITGVVIQKNGKLRITYIPFAESAWHCPGAVAEESEDAIVLNFARAPYNARPIVTFPNERASENQRNRTIEISPEGKRVYLGKEVEEALLWDGKKTFIPSAKPKVNRY